MKKVICKIFEYYPETEQFDVAIGRLHSHKSIDEHIRVGVSCDRLDMTDFESFKYSLNQKSLPSYLTLSLLFEIKFFSRLKVLDVLLPLLLIHNKY